MLENMPRFLTEKELQAIHKVELSGAKIDYSAIVRELEKNAANQHIHKPIFDIIYRDYFTRQSDVMLGYQLF